MTVITVALELDSLGLLGKGVALPLHCSHPTRQYFNGTGLVMGLGDHIVLLALELSISPGAGLQLQLGDV